MHGMSNARLSTPQLDFLWLTTRVKVANQSMLIRCHNTPKNFRIKIEKKSNLLQKVHATTGLTVHEKFQCI